MLSTAVPEMLRVINEDAERQVVISALETLAQMLKEIKLPVVEAPGVHTVEQIMNVVKDIMQQKVSCQKLCHSLSSMKILILCEIPNWFA